MAVVNCFDPITGATVPLNAAFVAGLLSGTPSKIVASNLVLDTGTKTATAVAGAATLNKASGVVTTEALTTAAGGVYTLTLTNSDIAAGDIVMATLANGTNSAGIPGAITSKAGAGSATITVTNLHASAAFNGTLLISYAVFKNA